MALMDAMRLVAMLTALTVLPHGAGCTQRDQGLPGCAMRPDALTKLALNGKTGEELTRLVELPVVKLMTESGCSSAIPLRRDLLLATRHALSNTEGPVEVDGRASRVRVLAAGAGDAWHDDWSYLIVSPPVERRVGLVARDRPARPGDAVYVLGYWHARAPVSRETARLTSRSIVEGLVVDPPDHPRAPSSAFICVQLPRNEALRGMSGGPVVRWDAARGDYVVVGLYRGAWQLVTDDYRTLASVHLVRRLPPVPDVTDASSTAPGAMRPTIAMQ